MVLVAIAASGARYLSVTNSFRIYFGPEDPHLVDFEHLENTYTRDDTVMLVLAPEDGKVFSREFLALLESVTEKAWQLPYASRVDSITNFQHTRAEEDDLIVSDLVTDAAQFTDRQLAEVKSIALAEPRLRGFLIAHDAKVAGININLLLPGIKDSEELPAAINGTRALITETEAAYPGVKIYMSGMAALNQGSAEAAISDMTVIGPISFAVMFGLIAFLAGGVVGTFTTLSVFGLSVAGALGIAGYIGFPITPSSGGAPNIILTIAVANSVHILISYFHEIRQGRSRQDAVIESLRINLHPVAIASITTAIGFLSMNFSESPPFQQLGTIVAMGVVISFILSVTFLPALLTVLPTGHFRKSSAQDKWVKSFGAFVIRRRRPVLWTMGIVVLALLANVPRNEFNDNFYQYLGEEMEVRIATEFMLDNLTGVYQIHYSLGAGDSGGVSDPEFLRYTQAFTDWWRAQPETRHVSSITDTLKRLNQSLHGDDAAMYRLPENRELAAQYLLLYEMSLPYGLDLNNQINVDKSSTRIIATISPTTITETLALTGRADNWLKQNAPRIEGAKPTGMLMMFTHMGRRNAVAMVYGTTLALALISLLLIVALRSLKIGSLSLVTNLAPIGMGFGIWGIINGEINIALSLVASMTFGIVVDDTVHFLSKYLRARREQGLSSEGAVQYAFETVSRALIVTSVVLVAGFMVLWTSDYGMNSKMGLSVSIVIVCALATVLLLLPPLLIKLEGKRGPAGA